MSFPSLMMAHDLAGSSYCMLLGCLIDWREWMLVGYVAGIAGEGRRPPVLREAETDR